VPLCLWFFLFFPSFSNFVLTLEDPLPLSMVLPLYVFFCFLYQSPFCPFPLSWSILTLSSCFFAPPFFDEASSSFPRVLFGFQIFLLLMYSPPHGIGSSFSFFLNAYLFSNRVVEAAMVCPLVFFFPFAWVQTPHLPLIRFKVLER